jgi:hypothetical protein
MVYQAHVRNGVVVLDDPIALPEGTAVVVEVAEQQQVRPAAPPVSLLDRLKSVVGAADGLPSDAASNVDHYLYGQPKS